MDQSFRLPLSGNVTQTINPWTWAFSGNSFALFNINLGRSANPGVEEAVLDRVGSYGRQLGQVADAVIALIDQLDPATLTPAATTAFARLRAQVELVDVIKHEFGVGAVTPAGSAATPP